MKFVVVVCSIVAQQIIPGAEPTDMQYCTMQLIPGEVTDPSKCLPVNMSDGEKIVGEMVDKETARRFAELGPDDKKEVVFCVAVDK